MPSKTLELKSELIRAGAGAGKTTALIEALITKISSYYKEHQVFPKVAVSTFTRKATREIKERLMIKALELGDKKLIEYINYSPRLKISTLHGLFNYFIQNNGHKIGLSPGITLMSEKESHELFVSVLKQIIFETNRGSLLLDHYSFEEIVPIINKYILHFQNREANLALNKEEMSMILRDEQDQILQGTGEKPPNKKEERALLDLKNEEKNLDIFISICQELSELSQQILVILDQRKRELGQITLNDLEVMTLKILEKESRSTGSNWNFWFLDEYQDISPIQKKILNQMSQNSSVFIVGDPQQSIYYFRGADLAVFQQKEKEMPQSQIKYLSKNYRSCPELVCFFNDFFAEKDFKKMQPVKEIYDNKKEVVQFILVPHDKKDANATEELELKACVDRINNLLEKGIKPEEIAVLSSKNKPLYLTARYLKNKNIPFHIHSSGNFRNRREIVDALFLLRFLLNPHDDENLIGLIRTPYCRIADQTIGESVQKNLGKTEPESLWNSLLDLELPVINKLKACLENLQTLGLVQNFQQALESLGFIDLSYYQDPTGVREANLWKLIYCLKDYELKGPFNLYTFIDHLFYENLKIDTDEVSYSQNAVSAIGDSGVQLMTIHAAKGLEFKHVIILKLSAGFMHRSNQTYFANDRQTGKWILSIKSEKEDKRMFSSFHKKIWENQKQSELEEFDRLLYVAMTRAKESLTLIGTNLTKKMSWMMRFPFLSNLKKGEHQAEKYRYYVQTN